jgi:hypothetical protein
MASEIKMLAGVDRILDLSEMTRGRQGGRDMASPQRLVGYLNGVESMLYFKISQPFVIVEALSKKTGGEH